MLKLAADLRFLHEPSHQLGPFLMALKQHLDRQVSAQVGVASLEDRSHPAAGNLAEKLVALATLAGCGHLVRRRLDHGHTRVVGRRIGKQHPGNRPDRPRQRLEHMTRLGRLETEGRFLRPKTVGWRASDRASPARNKHDGQVLYAASAGRGLPQRLQR